MKSFSVNIAAAFGVMVCIALTLWLRNWFFFLTVPAAIACAVCWGKTVTGEWDFDK